MPPKKNDTQSEAERQEQELAAQQEAEEKRAAEAQKQAERAQEKQERAEKRAAKKDQPEGEQPNANDPAYQAAREAERAAAGAPTQVQKSGETAYSHDRLIAEAEQRLGRPSYVVAGALALSDSEYLTIEDAQAAVVAYLGE